MSFYPTTALGLPHSPRYFIVIGAAPVTSDSKQTAVTYPHSKQTSMKYPHSKQTLNINIADSIAVPSVRAREG